MLLVERSAERYPSITSSTLRFLKQSVEEYFPRLKEVMSQNVALGMRTMLEKKVIRQVMGLF